MGFLLFKFTHLTHAGERVYASASVIKRSLIIGRIHFKFARHILQITTSSMGYVLFMFTRGVHAFASAHLRAPDCESVFASARIVKHSLIFVRILF
jgi:hypothetical protein